MITSCVRLGLDPLFRSRFYTFDIVRVSSLRERQPRFPAKQKSSQRYIAYGIVLSRSWTYSSECLHNCRVALPL